MVENPQEHRSNTRITVDRQTAIKGSLAYLDNLPINKALAIRRGVEELNESSSHFSIVDLWNPNSPRENSIALRGTSPSTELKLRLEHFNHIKRAPVPVSDSIQVSVIQNSETLLDRNKKLNEGMTLRELSGLFDPILGILKVPASYALDESPFAKFYVPERRMGDLSAREGEIELSGERSHIGEVKGIDYRKRLELMGEDIRSALKYVREVYRDRSKIENPRDFLMFLGVLDLLKTHSLMLFHISTYEERNFDIPEEDKISYFERKMTSMYLMEDTTRMYYQTLLGLDYDPDMDFSRMKSDFDSLGLGLRSHMDKVAASVTKPIDGPEGQISIYGLKQQKYKFKSPEVQNPLVIALGVQEAIRQNGKVDIITGVPSGGTEAAVVTQLLSEVMKKGKPSLFYLPVSIHSETHVTGPEKVAEFLKSTFKNAFDNKSILVVDDNSSTGETLKIVAVSLLGCGAKEVKFHLVDMDMRRLVSNIKGNQYFNPKLTGETTMGITNIGMNGEYSKRKTVMERLDRIKRMRRPSRNKIASFS